MQSSMPDPAAVIASYFPGSRFRQGYIKGKVRSDPAYRAVLDLVESNPLPLIDIGCGLGLLGFYLRLHGYPEAILGIDTDEAKIRLARAASDATGSKLEFRSGSAAHPVPHEGHTVLLDVLHYLDASSQEALLTRLANNLRGNGRVIIRNTPRDGSWRYRLTVLEEWWVRASGWIPLEAPICFPTIDEIVRPFAAIGCETTVAPLWGKTPFNSHLFVFERRDCSADADRSVGV